MPVPDDHADPLPPAPPMVVVISGPSGVGKTVICERLLAADPSLVRSISATTRPMREDEQDGVHYYFWAEDRFRQGVQDGMFLEWAEVHGHRYGTPRPPIEEHLQAGRSPLLNVDVQGGRSVKRLMPGAVLIFVFPPSIAVLEQRLRGRGTDPEAEIQRRLADAREEMKQWRHYDYAVVNRVLEDVTAEVQAILAAERAKVARRLEAASGSG